MDQLVIALLFVVYILTVYIMINVLVRHPQKPTDGEVFWALVPVVNTIVVIIGLVSAFIIKLRRDR